MVPRDEIGGDPDARRPTGTKAAGMTTTTPQIAREAAELAMELEPSIYAEHQAVQGYPTEVLVAESHDATMVVVGSRGHGGFASMLLGSVSHEVAQHASCAVAIVPKTAARRQPTPVAAAAQA